jgi:hypothetical protein
VTSSGTQGESGRPDDRPDAGARLSFRDRTLAVLLGAALIPLLGYAVVTALIRSTGPDVPGSSVSQAVLMVFVAACAVAILAPFLFTTYLVKPLQAFLSLVEQAGRGPRTPVSALGDDEMAVLATRYNELVAEVERRDVGLGRVREAIARLDPRLGTDELRTRIAQEARSVFDLLAVDLVVGLVDVPSGAVIPGEPRPVHAVLRIGSVQLGLLSGKVSALRTWEPDDQLRFEIFATGAAIALRSAGPPLGSG